MRNIQPLALTLLASLCLSGCFRSYIDEKCIKGRISTEQAEEINKGPWQHLPTYNRDADGHCKDCAKAQDRVLAAECSQFIKEL